jgi:hypothetical protein
MIFMIIERFKNQDATRVYREAKVRRRQYFEMS